MKKRRITTFPKTILDLLPTAINDLALHLYILTEGRKGSKFNKPNITTFYETGIVHSLYKMMLMSPKLESWDVRIEEKHSESSIRNWVDLWLRDHKGGHPVRIEVGDFLAGRPGKINNDARKLRRLHQSKKSRSSWILALVRDLQAQIEKNHADNERRKLALPANSRRPTRPYKRKPEKAEEVIKERVCKSIERKGLDNSLIEFDERLVKVFSVYRPGQKSDLVGAVMFRVKT